MNEIGAHQEYERATLPESDLDPDPFTQFSQWLNAALNHEQIDEPNVMTIATVDGDGSPSARVVLLRELDERGFVFFSNYESRKGIELRANPHIAAVFHWPQLQRQVRIEGTAELIESAKSDAYFAGRPLSSQMGAIASDQSAVIQNRDVIESAMRNLELQHERGEPVARPVHWGGYRIVPHTFEFWQGRKSRLHDRLRYRFIDSEWKIDRLAP
jgi:pyridoxamine 5'-phosphate oxidase